MHTVYFQIILNFFTPHCYWIGKVLPIAFFVTMRADLVSSFKRKRRKENKCNVQTSPFPCMIYYRRYFSPILDSSFYKPQSRMRHLLNPRSWTYFWKASVSLDILKKLVPWYVESCSSALVCQVRRVHYCWARVDQLGRIQIGQCFLRQIFEHSGSISVIILRGLLIRNMALTDNSKLRQLWPNSAKCRAVVALAATRSRKILFSSTAWPPCSASSSPFDLITQIFFVENYSF